MAFGSILLAAIGIGMLVFLHELGHFVAARLAGVRVEVFSLGYGPRLWGFEWRGTDFRLSAVPFGGYVMVAGADPSDRRYPAAECLWAKGLGQRTLFWSGGVLMNVLLALVLFPIAFRAGVDFTAPIVGRVEVGSAAWEARLQPGDRIVAIGQKQLYSGDNLLVEIALTGGRPTVLTVRGPAGDERKVTVEPQWNGNDGRYELGIETAVVDGPMQLAVEHDSPAQRAGVREGDLLLAVDGKPVRPQSDDPGLLPLAGANPFTIRVQRDAQQLELRVEPIAAAEVEPARIGVGLLPRVVRGLRPDVPIVQRLGLSRGDVLLAIDDQPFVAGKLDGAKVGPTNLRLQIRRAGKPLLLEQPATADERAAFVDSVALQADDSLMLWPHPDGAAAAAGLRAGDRIVAVGGTTIRTFDDLRRVVEGSSRHPLTVEVVRAAMNGVTLDATTGDLTLADKASLTITPRQAPRHLCGLVPQSKLRTEMMRAESFGQALAFGASLSVDMIKQLYVTVKKMVTGDVGAKNLGGIIKISQVSYQAAQRGFSWFLYLLAMLSLNLAFVNLLPIPVLDGGHLLFLLIEKVKGSPVSARVFGYSQVVGLVFVLMLLLFVTYNDILQLL
jgi:regulator of sigma E protease